MTAIHEPALFLCSEECVIPGLPVAFRIVQYLRVATLEAKAAVIETASPVYEPKKTSFVVLAKGNNQISEANSGSLVGVYLLPKDQRVKANELDLSAGLQPVIDWCAITSSKETAERWQPNC